jgi:hypothetical protein
MEPADAHVTPAYLPCYLRELQYPWCAVGTCILGKTSQAKGHFLASQSWSFQPGTVPAEQFRHSLPTHHKLPMLSWPIDHQRHS